MFDECTEIADSLEIDLSAIATYDDALKALDRLGMTTNDVGYQVRANIAESLLHRANFENRRHIGG